MIYNQAVNFFKFASDSSNKAPVKYSKADEMAKGRDSNMQPLGICHRFFKFIMNHLSSQGIKRVTLGLGRESVEVPVEEGSSSAGNRVKMNATVRRLSKRNGEVVIEFRHIEALENASPQQNGMIVADDDDRDLVQTRKEPRRHSQPASMATSGRMVMVPAPKNSAEGPREIKQPRAAPEMGLTTMTPVRESAWDGEKETKSKQDPRDIAIHHPTSSGNYSIQSQDTEALSQRLLQRTESNINEKADAFIRSRKEALRQALQP